MQEKLTILVTGATGSIGRATGRALARRGARVVLIGRRPGKLKQEVEAIEAYLAQCGLTYDAGDVSSLVADFADFDSVRHAAAEALTRYPRIDGLILSVGAFLQGGPHVLPNGHEMMFASNVAGPFLFTQVLMPRLIESNATVAHVIAPFDEALDWGDLESLEQHRAMQAFNRTKTCNRMIAGELARRYAGKVSSVAFDPSFVSDRADPDLKKRWPKGLTGLGWRVAAAIWAKSPETAGEPLAELFLVRQNRKPLNGALFKLYRRVDKPDAAMHDAVGGTRLWEALALMTNVDEARPAPEAQVAAPSG